jgi:hypothetical protein
MFFFRALAAYRLTDKNRNKDIRKEMSITNTVARIKVCQTKRWKHVERMEDPGITKINFKYNPACKIIQEDHNIDGNIDF